MNSFPVFHLSGVFEEILESRIPIRIQPEGLSMHPFIRKGDIITLTPCFREQNIKRERPSAQTGKSEIEVGDIVLFKSEGGRWLIHRAINRKGEGKAGKIVTKGDSLLGADHPVAEDRIWGKVTCLERAGSGKRYELEKPIWPRIGFLIALLSRAESALFSLCLTIAPRFSDRQFLPLVRKGIKLPKWLLIRVFFPY